MTVKSLLDIETGAFELADTPMVAVDRFYDRLPDAQPWVILIGHRAVFRFGTHAQNICLLLLQTRIYFWQIEQIMARCKFIAPEVIITTSWGWLVLKPSQSLGDKSASGST